MGPKVVLLGLAICLAGCERAGVDLENSTARPVEVSITLRDDVRPDDYHDSGPILLPPGNFMLSVWYLREYESLEIHTGNGRRFMLEGKSLSDLARQCPKHCILRITEDALVPVQVDLFGNPKA